MHFPKCNAKIIFFSGTVKFFICYYYNLWFLLIVIKLFAYFCKRLHNSQVSPCHCSACQRVITQRCRQSDLTCFSWCLPHRFSIFSTASVAPAFCFTYSPAALADMSYALRSDMMLSMTVLKLLPSVISHPPCEALRSCAS